MLLQDQSRELSVALSNTPNARQQARDAVVAIAAQQPYPGEFNSASDWLLHLRQGLANLHESQQDSYWRGYLGAMLTHIDALIGEPPRACGCPEWCGDRAVCTPDANQAELMRRAAQALVQAATIKGLVLTVEQTPVQPLETLHG